MSFDHTPDPSGEDRLDVESLAAQILAASAQSSSLTGRHSAEIFTFPAAAIVRPPPGHGFDQVAVVHRGMTEIFATPAEAQAALRSTDPEVAHLRRRAADDLSQAAAALREAKAAKARAEQRLELLAYGAFVAAAFALICTLGWVL